MNNIPVQLWRMQLLPSNDKKENCEYKRRKCKKVKSAKFSSVCKAAPNHLSEFAGALMDYFCEVGKLISCEPDTQVCNTLVELLRIVTILGNDIFIVLKCFCRCCRRLMNKRKDLRKCIKNLTAYNSYEKQEICSIVSSEDLS
ncbi:PREDICTED: uncharacterized protein LOC106122796 [Papilio xuthus]|uniref:Uncharacterized protein LOC106122796 n=1 Tax=Papilio xuthus TaxID=66420 RepID=A0AAJ6ZKI8_PAPXU|nr:PREDICTED: uncharacterized protein LOC106122796 [Papilio xuthus]